ncbi:MAG TPA: HAMP domain-containing sensor histidine kinase, partial [bacterium]|nr:HAMP domain-containing sensor histidine kinase [bacterium]
NIINITDNFEKILNISKQNYINRNINDIFELSTIDIVENTSNKNLSILTTTIIINKKVYFAKISFYFFQEEKKYFFIITIENLFEFFGGLLDQLGIAMHVISKDRTIIYFNKASQNYFNIKECMKCYELPDNITFSSCQQRCLFNTDKKMPNFESERLLSTTLGKRYFKIVTMPIYDITNSMNLLIKIFFDITETVNLIQQLKETNAILEENTKLKNEFISNVSHELKTPLTSILGYTELSLKRLENPSFLTNENNINFLISAFKSVDKSSKRLLELISNLLNFSSIELKRSGLFISLIDFNEIVDRIKSEILYQAEDKHIDVNFKLSNALKNIKFYNDKEKLNLILCNLLSNAIKFTDNGYVNLEIDYNLLNDEVVFTIKDTGIGIDPNQYSLIFEPFRQIDGTLTRKYRGIGLGLALVKKIVDLLQGTIDIDSEKEKGATIIVKLKNLKKENTIC